MKKNNNSVLEAIIQISKNTHEAKVTSLKKVTVRRYAEPIQHKFHCSTDEAIFFAIIFSLYFDRGFTVDVKDIANHLDCDAVELLSYEFHLSSLLKKKLIALDNDRKIKGDFSYRFKKQVMQAVLTDKEPEKQHTVTDNISLLSCLAEIIEQYTEKEMDFQELEEQVQDILQENDHIYFAKKLSELQVDFTMKVFLLYVIIKCYKGELSVHVTSALEELFWGSKLYFDTVKTVIIRKHTMLFKNNLLKTTYATWKNDVEVELTQEGAKFLFKEDACLILVDPETSDYIEKHVIQSSKIALKDLYYNPEDLPTIDFIHHILKPDNYDCIKNRLQENNMQQGISILLHGKPGTGKTETVFQLAKATNRNIYRVDISEMKSMWYGESQKKIKKLFEDYYEYAEKQPITPILLFNEADGVINKRKDSNSSSVGQTENEIQNILLQEMEEFKGILIATTNLVDNIDSAFDRRFLFKLELTVPTPSTRYEIYKSLLPKLSDNDLWILAEDFAFSGGVIQNIVRKATMHHVLYGEYPDLQWYIHTCRNEQFNSQTARKKIGFNVN